MTNPCASFAHIGVSRSIGCGDSARRRNAQLPGLGHPLLKGREIAHYMRDSGAMILLTWQEPADQASTGTAELRTDLVVLEAPTAGAYDPATIVE